jgi:hypothetical protein
MTHPAPPYPSPPLRGIQQSLIEACGEPGASVAGVALANRINANQLRRWMRERGIEPPALSCLPLRVVTSEPMGGFVPVQLSSALIHPSARRKS